MEGGDREREREREREVRKCVKGYRVKKREEKRREERCVNVCTKIQYCLVLTSAVFSSDCIAMVTLGTGLTVVPSSVVPAIDTCPCC